MENTFSSSTVDLIDNKDCKIDNPLRHRRPEQNRRDARAFAQSFDHDPAVAELFVKGALVAENPSGWRSVRGLLKREKQALDDERDLGFWQQTKTLRVAVITLCFSAILQGWIQTGSNGANLDWPVTFGLRLDEGDARDIWIFASVNAVTFLSASLCGCWISDPLQSAYLGRRGAILVSAFIALAALIGSACTQTWQQLIGCRALLGVSVGAKASITPIYSAEISPSHLRGVLVMNWQLFDALGIFLGFTANLVLYKVGPLGWRFQIASACIPVICLLALIWTIPESPRWLLKQGRLSDAYASMCMLRTTPLQAARDIYYANAQLEAEAQLLPRRADDPERTVGDGHVDHVENIGNGHADPRNHQEELHHTAKFKTFHALVQSTNYWQRIWQLFRDPRTRRATVAAAVVMIGQQLCGINVLAFYSTTFFAQASETRSADANAVWLSFGWGLANFLFTFPAYSSIDTRGRRFLLLTTYPFMFLSLLGACLSCLARDPTVRIALLGTFLFLFVLAYSIGQGPVAFTYASEVFPLINREAGMSFAVFVNLFSGGLLTLFVPIAQIGNHIDPTHYGAQTGQTRLLGAFVILNAIGMLLIFFFVRETAGAMFGRSEGKLNYLSLEDLNCIFGVTTRRHVQYQRDHMVPYFLRMLKWRTVECWDTRPRPNRPESLYLWANEQNQETELAEAQATTSSGGSSNNAADEVR